VAASTCDVFHITNVEVGGCRISETALLGSY
jgi:hypothetical protein